jgi:hypothetical protein
MEFSSAVDGSNTSKRPEPPLMPLDTPRSMCVVICPIYRDEKMMGDAATDCTITRRTQRAAVGWDRRSVQLIAQVPSAGEKCEAEVSGAK